MISSIITRLKRLFAIIAVSISAFHLPLSAANVTIRVRDANGAGVVNATVYAVNFGERGPDGEHSRIGTTDNDGNVTLALVDNEEYEILAEKHGAGPTGRNQLFSPTHPHVAGNTSDSPTVTLDGTFSGRGQITATVQNATATRLVFGSVRKKGTTQDIAFGSCLANGGGTCDIIFNNIPTAAANTYDVGVFDPSANNGQGQGYGKILTTSVSSGGNATITIDISQGLPPDFTANSGDKSNDEQNRVLAEAGGTGGTVRGVVRDSVDSSKTVPNVWVSLMIREDNGAVFDRQGTHTDQNGRFELRGLEARKYYLRVSGGCRQDSTCYSGYESDTARTNGNLDTNDFELTAGDISSGNAKNIVVLLTAAPAGTGALKVNVKNQNGTLIPGAHVNIWPDGQPFQVDGSALTCNGADATVANPGYTQKNAQAVDGTVVLSQLSAGNYMVQVWTPFSQQGTMFNAGPDGLYNWSPGLRGCTSQITGSADDRRITVNANNTVQVFDMTGTEINGVVTTVNSIPNITLTVQTGNNGDGRVYGTMKFPETVDLSADPITVILYGPCDNSGCAGNFASVNGSGSNQYTYETFVPRTKNSEPASYHIQVFSKYWGVVQAGGGQNQIQFKDGVTEVQRDFTFAKAGIVTGYVRKPDGSVLIPGNDGNGGYVHASVNVSGQSSWGHAQVGQDGKYTVGGVLPGEVTIRPQVHGGGADYAAEGVKARVIANTTIEKDVSFIKGAFVLPIWDTSNYPTLQTDISGGFPTGETYEIIRVKSGTPLDGNFATMVLTDHSDEEARFTNVPAGNGPCGPGWSGGYCGKYMAAGDAYDFIFYRTGNMEGPYATYPYLTILGTKENVEVSSSKATDPTVMHQGSSVKPVRVTYAGDAPQAGTTVKGTVIAENMMRENDFTSLGGDFNNFIKYIPQISVVCNNSMVAMGLVTPPPAAIEGAAGAQLDTAILNNDYNGFVNVVDGLTWQYEIRGVPPNKDCTLIGTTPNYPPVSKRVTTGANGSSLTWDINWDNVAGKGGTISGTVTDSNGTPIKSASVLLKTKGIKKTVTANASGAYAFEGLPIGRYKITATAPSYSPDAQKTVIGDAETDTVNFALNAGPGSIAGTILELSATEMGLVKKPVEGAKVTAYDDTVNAQDTSKPLALIEATTQSDGTYLLEGLVNGHTYKISAKAPGRQVESTTKTSNGAAMTGVDFVFKQKPLTIDVAIDFLDTTFKIKILNPNNFSDGTVTYYPTADSSNTTDISNSFTDLPDGSLVAELAKSVLTAGVPYTLKIVANPADGSEPVTRTIDFASGKEAAKKAMDQAMLGDETVGDDGVQANYVGFNGAGFELEPGALIAGSSSEIPSADFELQDPANLDITTTDTTTVGDIVKVDINDVNFTGRDVPLVMPIDTSTLDEGIDAKDLALYQYNSSTGELEKVDSTLTLDPLNGTVAVDVTLNNTVFSQVSISNNSVGGMRSASVKGGMNALRTRDGFRTNPRAAASGSASFVIGLAQSTGTVAATSYHQYNFPNPFNLKDKTVTLRSGTSGVGTSIRGTYIVVSPTGSGDKNITIRIYNVAGDMVREFKETARAGYYNYIHWDGKNTSGDDVASGVYFAAVDAPGAPKKEPIKMVLVK
ncbi:MAG: hypothetical protein KCHDKBKB_00126 [Elusimicrobia bacterium]|nr:hypothetical protein [Elusimicrobiota bacterium]